jgi:hypothetical protein
VPWRVEPEPSRVVGGDSSMVLQFHRRCAQDQALLTSLQLRVFRASLAPEVRHVLVKVGRDLAERLAPGVLAQGFPFAFTERSGFFKFLGGVQGAVAVVSRERVGALREVVRWAGLGARVVGFASGVEAWDVVRKRAMLA